MSDASQTNAPGGLSRRDWLRALGLGALAAPVLAGAAAAQTVAPGLPPPGTLQPLPPGPLAGGAPQPRPIVKPPRLRYGGTVGLVCPASRMEGGLRALTEVRDSLDQLGFYTKPGRHCLAEHGYLAGTDEQRAEDLMAMFEDDDVDAILALRGGWGTPRILPLLDYERIRANPKPLIGYSDITGLLLAIYARSGLVTFHGPVGRSTWNPRTADAFRRVLVHGDRLTLEGTGTTEEDGEGRGLRGGGMEPHPIVRGQAEGLLVGGNLTVLTTLVGTPYLPDLSRHVVFFEDVNEPLYRVDRLLTQLRLAGSLDDVAGIVFGQCRSCPGEDGADVEWLLHDQLAPLRKPAWSGAPIGHVSPVYTLPIGVPVRTDATHGTLELLEPAVT